MANLLTRQQIIDIWLEQDKVFLDSKCCPDCRSILETSKDAGKEYLYCNNDMCENESRYSVDSDDGISHQVL